VTDTEDSEAAGGDTMGESAAADSVTPFGGDPPTVVSAGHINWDVTIHVDRLPARDGETQIRRLEQSGGGSAANVAVGLVGLGGASLVFGSVGGDESGALALRELASAGVNPGHVLVDPDAQTSVTYVIVDGDGEVLLLSNEGANESFAADALDETVLTDADHLHLTGQGPQTAGALAAMAGDRGITRSFDPGRRAGDREYGAVIDAVDLVFVNDREADAVAAATGLDPRDPTDHVVAIKHGGEGATVYTPQGALSHPGFSVAAVDTAGAGDAFAAGFLTAALGGDGSRLPLAPEAYRAPLRVANACGAIAAETVAARTELSWQRIEAIVGDAA